MKSLPPQLARLADLAGNLRYSWDHPTTDLFRRLDPDRWEATNHNPTAVLQQVGEERLRAVAADPDFVADLDRAARSLDAYLTDAQTWFAARGAGGAAQIAYFSMEFGLHESLPIYSGGLGVLAGDHLKSASDLGVPLVAVGLFYQGGYFRQDLDESGWQQDLDETNAPDVLPLAPALGPDGAPVTVTVALEGRDVRLGAWLVRVGRVDLYLLDTNLPANEEEDRRINARLYGGEITARIKQEIVLGIGGCRLLEALGLAPQVYHMNEGHAAFLTLERIRRTMAERQISFTEAREALRPSFVFTTHTPVAAGHDYFAPELMEQYFGEYIKDLGLTSYDLLGLGRHTPSDYREYFCMTILALRLAAHANGVSRLHGEVSRQQWRDLWPGTPTPEVPITHITNGVHLPSFIAGDLARLYADCLRIVPGSAPADPATWEPIMRVPDADLWAARQRNRAGLLDFVHRRIREQDERHHRSGDGDGFDPQALTIGFARRFATYKRAALLMRDPDRLARLLNDPQRPVQIIFAGKAHPRDDGGKSLIQRIAEMARDEPFRHRIVFLEGYDIGVARQLVQGVDLWLNTPQRPYEASGTSGMKAAANGALNCSILDGWWVEAYEEARRRGGAIGWAIGGGETFDNAEHQAHVDAQALYDVLEREVVPAFYERGLDGVPSGWVARMKRSIAQLAPYFNTDRMVQEYTERFYLQAIGDRR